MLENTPSRATPQLQTLMNLSKVACSGLVDGNPDVRAKMGLKAQTVRLTDEIDGLIIHGSTSTPDFVWNRNPEDRIVLTWPRTRQVDIELSDKDVYAFRHEV
jgi:hypothetical protein